MKSTDIRQPITPVVNVKTLNPLTESVDFHTIRQGKATNTLAKIKTVIDDPAQLNLYGGAVITTEKDYKLFIEQYNELTNGVRPTAKMLLDALVIKLTESGRQDTLVQLPLSEYMEMRGLRDIKSVREQVKEDYQCAGDWDGDGHWAGRLIAQLPNVEAARRAHAGLHRTPFSPLRCVKVAAEYWRYKLR